MVALTAGFKEGMRARMKRDPELCREVLKEALEILLGGEVDVAKSMLRDYVIARLGFDELGRLTGKTPQSLMRMLGRTGNPQAGNLGDIIRVLQAHEGVRAEVRFKKTKAKAA